MVVDREVSEELNEILNMYVTAKQFKNAIPSEYVWDGYKIINIPIPYVVNLSFACEVYLKTLCKILKNNYGNKHEIKYLILKSKCDGEIREKVIKKLNLHTNYEIELDKINNAFKRWRYSYEHNEIFDISIDFIINFVIVLDEMVINLIKEKFNYDVKDKISIYGE